MAANLPANDLSASDLPVSDLPVSDLSASDLPAADTELAALLPLLSLDELGPNRLRALFADVTKNTLPDVGTATGTVASTAPKALAALRQPNPARLPHLLSCRGVTTDLLYTWARTLRKINAAELLQAHQQSGIHFITPAQLAQIPLWHEDPEPPMMLFCRGAPINYQSRRVAIVGTRRCSGYGRTVAKQLGQDLAQAGVTVISGLANGIDSAAQRAAQTAGGTVIAVVATGLDVVYPPNNSQLWKDIANSGGTLLSEYPLGAPPLRWRFPARNRLIAALAEVVVVVESGPTGGSFYTVDAAAERAIPVMAVPGPVTVRSSEGTNALLADGCGVVRDAEDVLQALELMPSLLPFPDTETSTETNIATSTADTVTTATTSTSVTASTAASSPARASSSARTASARSTATPKQHPSASSPARASSSARTASTKTRDDPTKHLDPTESKLLELLIAGPANVDELVDELTTQQSAAEPNQPSSAQPNLAQIALALDRLKQQGWVSESGGWWERMR